MPHLIYVANWRHCDGKEMLFTVPFATITIAAWSLLLLNSEQIISLA